MEISPLMVFPNNWTPPHKMYYWHVVAYWCFCHLFTFFRVFFCKLTDLLIVVNSICSPLNLFCAPQSWPRHWLADQFTDDWSTPWLSTRGVIPIQWNVALCFFHNIVSIFKNSTFKFEPAKSEEYSLTNKFLKTEKNLNMLLCAQYRNMSQYIVSLPLYQDGYHIASPDFCQYTPQLSTSIGFSSLLHWHYLTNGVAWPLRFSLQIRVYLTHRNCLRNILMWFYRMFTIAADIWTEALMSLVQ